MIAPIIATFAFIASTLAAPPAALRNISAFACGSHLSPNALAAAESHFAAHAVSNSANRASATIPVYFHVINKGSGMWSRDLI